MAPLIVLCGSFVVFAVLGRLGVRGFRDLTVALRWALAFMFFLTSSAHFTSMRGELIAMVPPVFPAPGLLVTITGILELAGAIGLLIPRFARASAIGLALLLLAMFPANVYAALEGLTLGGKAVTPLVPRTVMQIGFVAALLLPLRVAARTHPDLRR
jgi:uncharacterized membrane protein